MRIIHRSLQTSLGHWGVTLNPVWTLLQARERSQALDMLMNGWMDKRSIFTTLYYNGQTLTMMADRLTGKVDRYLNIFEPKNELNQVEPTGTNSHYWITGPKVEPIVEPIVEPKQYMFERRRPAISDFNAAPKLGSVKGPAFLHTFEYLAVFWPKTLKWTSNTVL